MTITQEEYDLIHQYGDLVEGDLERNVQRLEAEIVAAQRNMLTDWAARLASLNEELSKARANLETFREKLSLVMGEV